MITQEDVAKKAGVSLITVSRVINNRGYVKEETRQKIQKVVKELNYYANHIGQALRSKKVNTIGIIIPEPPDVTIHGMEYYNTIMQGIDRSAFSHETDILLSTYDQENPKVDYFRLFFQHKVDGLILFIPDMKFLNMDLIKKNNIPCVIVGERPQGISYVDAENFNGMFQVTEYLLSKGMRNIAFIKGKARMLNSQDRLNGFLKAMEKNGIPVDPEMIFDGNYTSASGQSAVRKIFETKNIPEALVCANDLTALGAMTEAKKLGIKIPSKMALIGFDDISVTSFTDPPLSTVRQPLFNMGFTASEFLFNKIQNPDRQPETMIFPVELITRKSA